jgi:hypothetical protein
MTDPIDFLAFLERQRERAEALRAEAELAAEQARQAYRDWEHGVGQEIVGIAYPWDTRPVELPLERFELEFCFKLTNGSFVKAAKLLKVSEGRLAQAVHGTEWARHAPKAGAVSHGPVTASYEGGSLVVRIKKPNKKRRSLSDSMKRAIL